MDSRLAELDALQAILVELRQIRQLLEAQQETQQAFVLYAANGSPLP